MAYSIVAACVMLLRFEIDDEAELVIDNRSSILSKLFNTTNMTTPTPYTSGLVTIFVTLYACLCIWMSLIISLMGSKLLNADPLAITLLVIPIVGIVITLIIISRQPRSAKILTFSVPFTPWFPALSIMINIYLMVELDVMTWIRFAVWIAVGLLIYFFYGYRNSNERKRELMETSSNGDIDKIR
jgi:solute carrier family 7 (cationic amino acid transporter), member 2